MGPYLDDQPPDGRFGAPAPTVRPGGSLEIHGHWYTSTCNDQGEDDPVVPLPDVTLTVTFPGGDVVRLGPFTPGGRDMGFAATIEVPADAGVGPVTVSDDREYPATYRFRIGGSAAPLPEVVEWDGEGYGPPITLDLDGERIDLDPWTTCYGNGCADGAPRPPYVDVGQRDAVPFSFPDAGWTFEATFRTDDYDDCPRAITVPVRKTGDRTFAVTPAGPPRRWLVDVFGRGPGGDVITTFTWTTRDAGALPGPATGSAAVLADHDGELDSYGVEIFVQDLVRQPGQASATVTVTSAGGDVGHAHAAVGAGVLLGGFAVVHGVGRRGPPRDPTRCRPVHLRRGAHHGRQDLPRPRDLARRRDRGHRPARPSHLDAGAPGVRRLTVRR